MLLPALLGCRSLLRGAARAAHHRAAFLDDVTRVGGSVLVRLQAAPRVVLAVERARICFLLRGATATPAEDAVEETHRRSLCGARLRSLTSDARSRLIVLEIEGSGFGQGHNRIQCGGCGRSAHTCCRRSGRSRRRDPQELW